MPNVDRDAPQVTNSDAAMWREDHDAAKRYIEALLEEREESKAVMEKAREYGMLRYRYVTAGHRVCDVFPKEVADAMMSAHAELQRLCIAAALKEGNADG